MAIAFIGTSAYLLFLPVNSADKNPIEVNVESGDSLRSVADKLEEAGLIYSKSMFIIYVKARGDEDDLKAGRYVLNQSLNIPMIVSLMVLGKSKPNDVRLLIPEGFNIWEIDERLVKLGLISEGQFASKYHDDEGYLFPDTYQLHRQSITGDPQTPEGYIQELRDKMTENFNTKTDELLNGLSYTERMRILVVASILEKEARLERDMKLVAGIIYNRLELDMPLQIDATVLYGACIKEAEKVDFMKDCKVHYQSPALQLKADSPFNTYIRKGLPPSPIANPGLNSIEAALNPTESNYLYYLSTRDGVMIYSKTAAEHVANRKKYLGI